MDSTVDRPDRGSDPEAGVRGVRPRRIGAVLVLGAVVYGTNALIFNRIVFRIAYGGPPGLVSLLTNPLWPLFRAMGVVGVLLIAVGLVLLLDRYPPPGLAGSENDRPRIARR